MLASQIQKRGYVSFQGKNHFLTPAHDWIHDCIRDWNLGLDPEVGSDLECEYSETSGAAKAAWYGPCASRSLGEASARVKGGKVRWVVGWVCGRIFSWCEIVKVWSWGVHDGIFLVR